MCSDAVTVTVIPSPGMAKDDCRELSEALQIDNDGGVRSGVKEGCKRECDMIRYVDY